MNAIFERSFVAFLFVSFVGGDSIAQEVSDIAWTREDRSDECTRFVFDMPASLVPILTAGTPSAEPTLESFDGKIIFWVSDNSSHLDIWEMSKAKYINWSRCSEADKRSSKCLESDHILAKARISKADWFGDGKATCMEVDAIAPDNSNDDRSRFGAMIQMCGPAAAKTLIQASIDRIIRSLEFSYLGCCKAHDHTLGCK